MDCDLVISGGTVIDGTGQPRFPADVGIRQGRIVAVARGARLYGSQTVDASGLIVAPGFVDIHSHFDWELPLPDHGQVLAPIVLQGVTTLVTGNCGQSPAPVTEASLRVLGPESYFRWRTVREFLDNLEDSGVLLNVAFLVGHGTLRYAVMGERAGPATAQEVGSLCRLTRQALREGAFGMSMGLAYTPGMFAAAEELQGLVQTVAEEKAVCTVHGRAYRCVAPLYRPTILGMPHNVRSIREDLALARKAGVRIQLSHLMFSGRRTWRTYHTVLRDIERAAEEGVDVAFDAFPYTISNTTIRVNFPKWFLADFAKNIDDPRALGRVKRGLALQHWLIGRGYRDIVLMSGAAPELSELEGLDFAAIAQRLGLPEFEAYAHVARVSKGEAMILQGTMSGDAECEEPLRAVLSHRLCAFETDTVMLRQGYQNRASFGTFPRVLGQYSRDLKLFPLEEAVRRMTSFSAERIGLANIGRVAEGMWADLVLFDAATIADNTTDERPDAPPTGIRAVLISGKVVARDGSIVTKERCGRVLRR